MWGALGAVCLLLLATSVGAAPLLTHVTDPTPPGKLFNAVGDGWDPAAPEVRVCRLGDGEPGLPPTRDTPPLGTFEKAPVLRAEPQVLTASMPTLRFGIFAVQVRSPEGWSPPLLINAPRADWLSTDRAAPGQTVRVFGRNLVGLDLYPEQDKRGLPVSYGGYVAGKTRVVLKSGAVAVSAPVERMSAYDVHFRVPTEIRPGEYQVYVHNGYGGPAGWSAPLGLTVRSAERWPDQVFDVREFGAVGDGRADDAGALQAALDAAAANGGGIVYLPAGSYLINTGLTIGRRTVLRGESRERTWIWLPNGVHYGSKEDGERLEVALTGDGDFIVEDLTIHGVYAKYLIQAPVQFADQNAPKAENVTIRRCQLLVEPVLRGPYRGTEPFLVGQTLAGDSNWCYRFAVALRGDYCTVQDCNIRGAGSCIHLVGSRYCAVQRNELLQGHGGESLIIFPGQTTPSCLIFEENRTRPVASAHSGALWSHVRGNFYYIARNNLELDWARDNECILFHSSGTRFAPPVQEAGADTVTFDSEYVAKWAAGQRSAGFWDGAAQQVRPGALKGYDCLVIEGPGLGQLRTVVDNTEDTLRLDRPWEIRPTAESRVALCQAPNFRGHLIVDNVLHHTGPGIDPWGNGFDWVVDGNRLARSGGINICDVGSPNTYREWAGNYFIQMLHNTLSEGRYHGKWDTRAATHIFQGTLGLDPQGASLGVAGLGLVMRGNRTESDCLICVVPRGAALYRGTVVEDNTCTTSLSGIWVGENVSGALRGNRFSQVNEPLRDDGSACWMHPGERLAARLAGLRSLLERMSPPVTLGWARIESNLVKLTARSADDARLPADCQALLRAVWEETAQKQPRGGYPLEVLHAMVGLSLRIRPGGSLEQILASGKGGAGKVEIIARTTAEAPDLTIQPALQWPEDWTVGAAPSGGTLLPGQEALLSAEASVPTGAWGTYRLPVALSVAWEGVALQSRAELSLGRAYLSEWQVLGSFPNAGQGGNDDTAHPPEQGINLKGKYAGIAGEIRWQAVSGLESLDFTKLCGAHPYATAYALACLRAESAGSVRLSLAADDGVQAWLNQAPLLRKGPDPSTTTFTAGLQAGDNYLLCKVTNKGGGWSLRVTAEGLGALTGGRLRQVPAAELSELAALNPAPLPAGAEPPDASGVAWTQVFADDFQGVRLAPEWVVAGGEWRLVNGAVRGTGPGAFLCYRTPLPAPARLEYDARSPAPADLSACWLDSPGDYTNGYLFAFAAGNAVNRLDSYGGNLATSDKPLAVPNRWHHVVAQFLASGRFTLSVDGQTALTHQAAPPGTRARYLGVWTWGEGDFDNLRLFRGTAA